MCCVFKLCCVCCVVLCGEGVCVVSFKLCLCAHQDARCALKDVEPVLSATSRPRALNMQSEAQHSTCSPRLVMRLTDGGRR